MYEDTALPVFQYKIADRLIDPARKLKSRLVRGKLDLCAIRIIRVDTQPFEGHRFVDAVYFEAGRLCNAIPAKFYPRRHAYGQIHHLKCNIPGHLAADGLLQQADLYPCRAGSILIRMPEEYAASSVIAIHFAENQLPVIDSRIFLRCGKIKGDGSARGWKNSRRQWQSGRQLIDGRLRGKQARMARRNRQRHCGSICSYQ
ncbi:hypothetical protein [Janthinobacterium sp. P210006]|uniref:hypothetical protein n=1 Tax=Janthinobacterium sp. P210006 TaxID=3112939 RepID=UPI002E2597DA|nr:hypothetical protein [Janthinobacterium sp. P210006]